MFGEIVKSVLVCTLSSEVFKQVLIPLYQQWLMNGHNLKTKVNNMFEVGKVNCERKKFSFST